MNNSCLLYLDLKVVDTEEGGTVERVGDPEIEPNLPAEEPGEAGEALAFAEPGAADTVELAQAEDAVTEPPAPADEPVERRS